MKHVSPAWDATIPRLSSLYGTHRDSICILAKTLKKGVKKLWEGLGQNEKNALNQKSLSYRMKSIKLNLILKGWMKGSLAEETLTGTEVLVSKNLKIPCWEKSEFFLMGNNVTTVDKWKLKRDR